MEMVLEREFTRRAFVHKMAVLKAVMMKHYADLQDTNTVCIPDFLRQDTPEKLAEKEIEELLILDNNGERINHLYNIAWEVVKESLP